MAIPCQMGAVDLYCLVRLGCSAEHVVQERRQNQKHIGCVRTVETNLILKKKWPEMAQDYGYRETARLSSESRQEFFYKRLPVSGLCQMYRSYFSVCFCNDYIFYLSTQCRGLPCAELPHVPWLVCATNRCKRVQ